MILTTQIVQGLGPLIENISIMAHKNILEDVGSSLCCSTGHSDSAMQVIYTLLSAVMSFPTVQIDQGLGPLLENIRIHTMP